MSKGGSAVVVVDGFDLTLEQDVCWSYKVWMDDGGAVLRAERRQGERARVLVGGSDLDLGVSEDVAVTRCLAALSRRTHGCAVLTYHDDGANGGHMLLTVLDAERCAGLRELDEDPRFWMNPAEHFACAGISGEAPTEHELLLSRSSLSGGDWRSVARRVVARVRAGLPPGSQLIVVQTSMDMEGLADSLRVGGYDLRGEMRAGCGSVSDGVASGATSPV